MRIKHIDLLRGVAALMVTIFHLARNTDVAHGSVDYAKYGWTGVQIFFVISGFILPYSLYKTGYQTKDFGIFFLKRVVRIYPTYIAAIVIGIVLAIATGRELIPTAATASELLFLNPLLGRPDSSAVFWTLAIEFQFYLLIGLLYSYFLSSNKRSVVLIFALTIVSFWIRTPTLILSWLPFFGIGFMIFNRKFTNMQALPFWISVCTLLIIALITHGIPEAIASLFAVIFILCGDFYRKNLIYRIFLFIGTISYSLYLTHWDLGRAGVRLSRHFPIINSVGLLRVFTGVLLAVFCAWVLYIIVEKGSAKSSANIKYKKKDSSSHASSV